MNNNFCFIKGCNRETELLYYGKSVCERHWKMHCNPLSYFDLKKLFKIKETNNLKMIVSLKIGGCDDEGY